MKIQRISALKIKRENNCRQEISSVNKGGTAEMLRSLAGERLGAFCCQACDKTVRQTVLSIGSESKSCDITALKKVIKNQKL